MRIRMFLAVLAATMAATTAAFAQGAPPTPPAAPPAAGGGSDAPATAFGHAGQLAISWDQAIGTQQMSVNGLGGGGAPAIGAPASWSMLDFQYASLSNNEGSVTHFGLAPAADYFVIDNLSVGGQVLLGIASYSPGGGGQGATGTTFGIAPQVGYNLGLTDNISFWPKLQVAYQNTSWSNNGGGSSRFGLGIFAPFLYHPVNHFFAGIGPNFSTDLSSSVTPAGPGAQSVDGVKVTEFGIMTTFGGWFLGD